MKLGETLTVGKRHYVITECKPFEKCVRCKQENKFIPCNTWSAMVKREFNTSICINEIPNNCYPKQIEEA